jgi:hypothetical protein
LKYFVKKLKLTKNFQTSITEDDLASETALKGIKRCFNNPGEWFSLGTKKLRMRDSYTNPSEMKQIELLGIFAFTKQIFQKQTYKSNPQYKSLRFGFANPKLQDL